MILEPDKNEKFLNSKETLVWLEWWLKKFDTLPLDLQCKASLKEAAQHLLDTACDLEIKPGFKVQWYAVRLRPPGQ